MLKVICAMAAVCATATFVFSADSDSAVRGKYLVEEVGKCQDCHTPRLESGQLDKSKWLKGATLDFAPTHELKGWHKTSPDLTGAGRLFTRWKEEGLVKFLETGLGPTGNKADPPMPFYNLKHEDAQAIVDYLKTLQ
jgi:mono/diheme cytochrome c family protein